MKKFSTILIIFFAFLTSGYRKPDVYEIDATKNAYSHNNMGLIYVDEKYVITKSGFYENNSIPPSQGNTTDESISPMNLEYSSAVITKSENMLIYQEKIIFIFPNIE